MRQQKDWCRDCNPRIIKGALHAMSVFFLCEILALLWWAGWGRRKLGRFL